MGLSSQKLRSSKALDSGLPNSNKIGEFSLEKEVYEEKIGPAELKLYYAATITKLRYGVCCYKISANKEVKDKFMLVLDLNKNLLEFRYHKVRYQSYPLKALGHFYRGINNSIFIQLKTHADGLDKKARFVKNLDIFEEIDIKDRAVTIEFNLFPEYPQLKSTQQSTKTSVSFILHRRDEASMVEFILRYIETLNKVYRKQEGGDDQKLITPNDTKTKKLVEMPRRILSRSISKFVDNEPKESYENKRKAVNSMLVSNSNMKRISTEDGKRNIDVIRSSLEVPNTSNDAGIRSSLEVPNTSNDAGIGKHKTSGKKKLRHKLSSFRDDSNVESLYVGSYHKPVTANRRAIAGSYKKKAL